MWSRPNFRANFGFFEPRMFPWSPGKNEEGTFYPFHTRSRFQEQLHFTWSSSAKPTNVFIERFHSRGKHLCKLWEQKKEFTQERVQLSQDWFGTPIWPPFHCFGTPIWPRWRHVKTLNSLRREREGVFRARAVSLPNSILLPFRVKHLDLHSESRVMHLESPQPNAWTS